MSDSSGSIYLKEKLFEMELSLSGFQEYSRLIPSLGSPKLGLVKVVNQALSLTFWPSASAGLLILTRLNGL